MDDRRASESERQIEILKRDLNALKSHLAALAQQLRAANTGGYGGGGSASTPYYYTKTSGSITSSDNSTAGTGSVDIFHVGGTGAITGEGTLSAWNLGYGTGTSDDLPCSVSTDVDGTLLVHLPPVFLAKTVAVDTYPTVANKFYGVRPLFITATETEDGGGTFADAVSGALFAYNIGSKVPPTATKVAVWSAFNRLFFDYSVAR